jgi:hypothetical protein
MPVLYSVRGFAQSISSFYGNVLSCSGIFWAWSIRGFTKPDTLCQPKRHLSGDFLAGLGGPAHGLLLHGRFDIIVERRPKWRNFQIQQYQFVAS